MQPEMDLVQEAGVVELPHEVTTTHEPDVPATGGLAHSAMHLPDVTGDETNVSSGYRRKVVSGEHPTRPVRVVLLAAGRRTATPASCAKGGADIDGGDHAAAEATLLPSLSRCWSAAEGKSTTARKAVL